jgi:tetratricopeptide (TPR) repeat protein
MWMSRNWWLLVLFIPLVALRTWCLDTTPRDSSSDSRFAIQLTPGATIPLGGDASIFSIGGGASLIAQFILPTLPFLAIEGGAGYSLAPVKVAPGEAVSQANLSIISPRAGLGFTTELLPRLRLGAHAHGGWYFAFANVDNPESSASNPLLDTGLDLSYELLPSLTLGIGASYRMFFGLSNDIMVTLGTSYRFLPPKSGGILPAQLKPNEDLLVTDLVVNPVFPVFYKYYDDHPIGSLRIVNRGSSPIEKITVKAFVAQYMDNPKTCREIPVLRVGESTQVDLTALFNESVLNISEGTKVSLNISVESSRAGHDYGNETIQTLRLYDRNAIAWDDNRKVAAFVTMKDPDVLRFSKNVSSMVSGKASKALNPNLLAAMAIHEALTLYGIRYAVDPSTPYAELSAKKGAAIDYLQFPNQTLDFKAGDCDDLSILYSSLLEAIGIRTAFITVPGHIYTAFALGMTEEDARRTFSRSDDLIFRQGQAWAPVEVTSIGPGFLEAWKIGATEWRENQLAGNAGFYPTAEAWATFEPVGYTNLKEGNIVVPAQDAVLQAFMAEVRKLVEREVAPRAAELKAKLSSSGQDPKLINSLGVLYARYGMVKEAEAQFQLALGKREYLPSLLNMGNLALLRGDSRGALAFYSRAVNLDRQSAQVLLGLAKAYLGLEQFDEANRRYSELKRVDPALAERNAYLDSRPGDEKARASAADQGLTTIVWAE